MDTRRKLFISHKHLTIKAKDFANELTSHNVIEKNLNKQTQMLKEHRENNRAVRDALLQRGVLQEALPSAGSVKMRKD